MIEEEGKPLGLLTLSNLNEIPRQDWAITTAVQAMTPVDKFHLLKSDTGLSEALEEINLVGINHLPVITDGQVQGILSRESVTNFLHTLQ
jgi:CBS domain-containing protein